MIYDNNVVDVAFKLSIFNLLKVDIEFKLEFIVNTDKPDAFTSPTTFNVDKHDTGLFNVVVPETFNDDINVVELFNIVNPDIFKFAVTFNPVVFIDKYSVALIGSS